MPKQNKPTVTYERTGHIDADDHVVFHNHADACNCFGHEYELYLRALARHPAEPGITIWFPKLFDNDVWDNSISNDEETFCERRIEDNDGYIRNALNHPGNFRRLLFPAIQGPGNHTIYVFKGLYEVDIKASHAKSVMIYRRKTKRVSTYVPKKKKE